MEQKPRYQSAIRRPNNVTTRFSDSELKTIQELAAAKTMATSDWIRSTVVNAHSLEKLEIILILLLENQFFINNFLCSAIPAIAGESPLKLSHAELIGWLKSQKQKMAQDAIEKAINEQVERG